MFLPNLDLSDNKLTEVNISVLLETENLKVIVLAENPIVTLYSTDTNASSSALKNIDLSRTQLKMFDCVKFSLPFQMLNTSILHCHPYNQFLRVGFSAFQT
jgi:hypothetical protein